MFACCDVVPPYPRQKTPFVRENDITDTKRCNFRRWGHETSLGIFIETIKRYCVRLIDRFGAAKPCAFDPSPPELLSGRRASNGFSKRSRCQTIFTRIGREMNRYTSTGILCQCDQESCFNCGSPIGRKLSMERLVANV